jgi:hypothetical protein
MATTSFIWEGISVGGEPTRTERDFDAERKADRIPLGALLKEEGWSVEDLETARSYGFPAPEAYSYTGWVNTRRESNFSRRKIAAWRAPFKLFALKVK